MSDIFKELEIYCGEITAATARVFVRLPRATSSADARLTGTIVGPWRSDADTLTASYPFADCSNAADTFVAMAIVLDPCYWTPEMPFLYNVNLELRENDQTIASKTLQFGMRSTASGPLQHLNSDHQNQWPTPNR